MIVNRRKTVAWLGAGALAFVAARAEAEEPTPPETAGPFFPRDADKLESDADLTRLAGRTERAAGTLIEMRVRLVDPAGAPISGAEVDLWQANAAGRYAHPLDSANAAPLDQNFQGYARLKSGADGAVSALTIKPGGYLVASEGPRTPHLHWKIAGGGKILTTQSYFPGEPANESDFLMRAMGDASRRLIMAAGAPGAEGALGFDWVITLG